MRQDFYPDAQFLEFSVGLRQLAEVIGLQAVNQLEEPCDNVHGPVFDWLRRFRGHRCTFLCSVTSTGRVARVLHSNTQKSRFLSGEKAISVALRVALRDYLQS